MKIISYIINTLFPPRETERMIRSLTKETIKDLYCKESLPFCIALSPYRHPIIRSLITENKFYGNTQAQSLLVALVTEYLKNETGPLVLIPVPLGKQRLQERGFNQVEEVLKQVPSDSRIKILTGVCQRIQETKPQVTLSRSERLLNTKGVFSVKKEIVETIRDTTILIFDDVSTTGATLSDLKQSFTPHLHPSNRLVCIALAH